MKEAVRQNITVESLEYDAPVKASLFQPQIGPDVTIMDKIQGTTVYPTTAETTPTTTIPTTANANAVPPTPWTNYAPLAGIGFGLCVLAVGFLLWMRGAGALIRRAATIRESSTGGRGGPPRNVDRRVAGSRGLAS